MHVKRLINLPKNKSFFLFGPRQVGKSTLLKQRFSEQNTMVFNLLKRQTLTRLQNNKSAFIDDIKGRDKSKISHVVIDELQNLPEILDEVHYVLEEFEDPPHFILTGSSARKLKKGKANLLGGRASNLTLHPLSFVEIENSDEAEFVLNKALDIGSLPAVYLSSNKEDAFDLLDSYVDVYLKEEIQEEALVRKLGTFSEFLRFAAEEHGRILNFAKIAEQTGVSGTTIQSYYGILEDTLLGFFLRPFSRTVRTSVVKHPKFYFFDLGVARMLNHQIHQDLQPGTKIYGEIFESFIILEFLKLNAYYKKGLEFSFYRTRNNVEVDLVIVTPSKEVFAVEIKSNTNPDPRNLKGLKSFAEVYPDANLVCVSQITNKQKHGQIDFYPWQEFIKLFFQ